jgi:hypothetical protein
LSKHFLEKFMLRTSTIRIIIMITNMLWKLIMCTVSITNLCYLNNSEIHKIRR